MPPCCRVTYEALRSHVGRGQSTGGFVRVDKQPRGAVLNSVSSGLDNILYLYLLVYMTYHLLQTLGSAQTGRASTDNQNINVAGTELCQYYASISTTGIRSITFA